MWALQLSTMLFAVGSLVCSGLSLPLRHDPFPKRDAMEVMELLKSAAAHEGALEEEVFQGEWPVKRPRTLNRFTLGHVENAVCWDKHGVDSFISVIDVHNHFRPFGEWERACVEVQLIRPLSCLVSTITS